jgi:hypothetical protein
MDGLAAILASLAINCGTVYVMTMMMMMMMTMVLASQLE